MHYKTNRLNHDFQIAYFIAGSCQTPDAAYAILCDLRDDRSDALKNVKAGELRTKAKAVRAAVKITSRDEAERLDGQADMAEIEATLDTTQKNIEAAEAELATILKLMDRIQPLRKYSHLPDPQAHEAAQAEEWKLQLMVTAQNQLLMTHTVAPDHFATMRMHPAFQSELLPFLNDLKDQLMAAQGDLTALAATLKPKFDLPALLTSEQTS